LSLILSRGRQVFITILMFMVGLLPASFVSAEGEVEKVTPAVNVGTNSGLPLPRFVSLRSNRVNVRVGPDRNLHAVAWVYTKQGLPVEIIEEYENLRRIRDSDGDGGWVDQAFLSGKRTAMPASWVKSSSFMIRANPNEISDLVAEIEHGVIGEVRQCKQGWCELDVKISCDLIEGASKTNLLPGFLASWLGLGECTRNYRGWLKQAELWGVYPNEEF